MFFRISLFYCNFGHTKIKKLCVKMHCFNENAIFVSANKHTMHIYD